MENATAKKFQVSHRKSRAAYMRDWRRKRKEAELNGARPAEVIANTTPGTIHDAMDWIEAKLVVPSGPLSGQPFKLPDWQREWAIAAYGEDVREAGLSISRKNGKSGLIAALLLAHIAGPLAVRDWRGVVASLTGNLARELRDAMEMTALASGLKVHLKKTPPPGVLTGNYGARVNFLAADRATGHAIGADLAIIDEAGLLPEAKRGLWNALMSSISGRDGRLWAISIQGDGPMFEEMEQRAGAKGVHWQKWSAPLDCDLNSETAWHAANPALADGIKSVNYMRHQCERAEASPGNEAHFRAYDLNQPVDPEKETIVSVREFTECLTTDPPPVKGEIVVGIDLGGTVSMTAACAYVPATGSMLVRGAFGDDPPLSVRAKRDRMGTLYDRMVRDGELKLYPGKVTPVVPFLRDFFAEVGALGTICAVGCDRFRAGEAEAAFGEANLPRFKVEWRGQGAAATADGTHDVRAFQRIVRSKRLHMARSVMLEAAIASSHLRYDGAGNPALKKAGGNARIDALSAAVIAAGIGEFIKPTPLFGLSVV